jgi:hypothetical protein
VEILQRFLKPYLTTDSTPFLQHQLVKTKWRMDNKWEELQLQKRMDVERKVFATSFIKNFSQNWEDSFLDTHFKYLDYS